MNRPRKLRLILLTALVVAAPAAAQPVADSAAQVPIPHIPNVDQDKLFNERINEAKLRTVLLDDVIKSLPAGMSDPKLLRDLMQKRLQEHPEVTDLIRKLNYDQPGRFNELPKMVDDILRNYPGRALPAESQQVIQDFLGRQSLPMPASGGAVSGEGAPKQGQRKGGGGRGRGRGLSPEQRAAQREEASRREWARRLTTWAQQLPQDKLAEPLRNSSALRNLVNDLTQSSVDALRGGGPGEGLDSQLAHWETQWKSLSNWLPKDWSQGLGEHLATMQRPNFHLPDLNWSTPPLPAAASAFAAPAADLGGLGSAALVVLGLGLAAMAFWRLRVVRAAAPGRRWRRALGPWPLDPETVETRDQVIRAFEYLSLVNCGEAARSWHHRAIAERLGGPEAEHRNAAERLAALYEHARYAPEHLPEPDWTTARRPLTFLAGTGAV